MSSADNIAQAPLSVRESRAVVVGGGPVGSVAAAMLWFRGVRDVVLLEKVADFKTLNPSSSYALGLYPRGVKALRVVPELDELIGKNGAPLLNLIRVTANKGLKSFPFPPPLTSVRYYVREILLCKLKNFLADHTSVSTRYGAKVKSISYSRDGIELEIDLNGTVEKISSNLVIAADGRESIIASSLQNASDSIVYSKHGLGSNEKYSASVGLKMKSVVVNPDELRRIGVTDEDFGTSLVILDSVRSKKTSKEKVKLKIFPSLPEHVDAFGGLLGVMVNSDDSILWSIRTADEFYAYFQDNFPTVNVRELIHPSHVDNFLHTSPSVFPSVMRVNSITADVGLQSGVILLGDAAHSFPPDTGLGLNSGFEDVAKLAKALDSLSETSTVHDVLADYELRNNEETSALVYIARVAAPFQHGNAPIRRKIHSGYGIVRSLLAEQFPYFFALPLNMQALGLRPYSDMVERDRWSARIVFFIAFVALVGYAFYGYDQFQTYFL